jgi:hypothetical protein
MKAYGKLHATLALAALALPAGISHAGWTGTNHRQLFMVRMYTSEVPSAVVEEGRYVRIGVILPPKSKVVKVEAFMDEQDFGRSLDRWSHCDLSSGACEIDDVQVDGLARVNTERDVQILANFWNFHESQPRYAKLKVTFMPVGNPRKTYRPKHCWLRTECGYAGWMDAAYEEEVPVVRDGEASP